MTEIPEIEMEVEAREVDSDVEHHPVQNPRSAVEKVETVSSLPLQRVIEKHAEAEG